MLAMPRSLPTSRSTWLFVFFGSLMGVFVVSSIVAPAEAKLGFYEMSAQLLPALLVVLLLQAQIFNLRQGWEMRAHNWTGAWAAFYALLMLGFLVAAEFAALYPLATGRASDGSAGFVYGALGTAFAAVILIGVFGTLGGKPDASPPGGKALS